MLILVNQIVKIDYIREAHQRLIEIVKLIEANYGHDKITVIIDRALY